MFKLRLELPESLDEQFKIIYDYRSVLDIDQDGVVSVLLRDYFESGLVELLPATLPDGSSLKYTVNDEIYLVNLDPGEHEFKFNKLTGQWECDICDYLYYRDSWGIKGLCRVL